MVFFSVKKGDIGSQDLEIPWTPYLTIVGSESKTNISAEFPPDFNNLTKTLCDPQPSDTIHLVLPGKTWAETR